MMELASLRDALTSGALDARLRAVYGTVSLPALTGRLTRLTDAFGEAFGTDRQVGLFSGPGRTEIGGNHTDHQHGHVLAAAIGLDAVACAGANGTQSVRILSAGYPEVAVELTGLQPRDGEKGTSAALVRGVAARFAQLGFTPGGFDAVIDSTVLGGSGLSSSAAYEVLIGVIFNHLFCADALDMVQIAQIGQYAENVFFGKPCGLMDQLASAVGGIVSIDFASPEAPVVTRLDYDLSASGYALCIVDTHASHADLTDEYAAIPAEMGAVAAFFGKTVLREVDPAQFWAALARVRAQVGDRAVLRAIHFFSDDLRARKQAAALEHDNFPQFLALVEQSGQSSATMLQNLYCAARPQEQAVCVALAVARELLAGHGAARVHGGGFAGTIQAFVPDRETDAFRAGMEAVLGQGCCHFLPVRPVGGAVLT